MLSKLRYYEQGESEGLSRLRLAIEASTVLDKIGMGQAELQRVNSGTLSACFIAEQAGRCRFLKTNLSANGHRTLLKEGAILSAVYPEGLDAQCIESDDAKGSRIWLAMNALRYPDIEYKTDGLWDLLNVLSSNLAGLKAETLIPRDDSIYTLLGEAWGALDNLSNHDLLSPDFQEEVQEHLARVQDRIDGHEPRVCHGDLGPRNLMSDGIRTYAIDWEDAFWGVQGYDYLYWLTFFENRKHYTGNILGKTPLGKSLEISIMVMILLLKSELSFRNQSYLSNSLSINQRIQEVLALA